MRFLVIVMLAAIIGLSTAPQASYARSENSGSGNSEQRDGQGFFGRFLNPRDDSRNDDDNSNADVNVNVNSDQVNRKDDNTCAAVEARIDARIKNYDQSHDRQLQAYLNVRERINRIILRLDALDVNTTELRVDLKTLDSKIAKLRTDYGAYIVALREVRVYSCVTANTDFTGELKEARQILTTVQTDIKDIRDYYHNTIKPDIREVKIEGRTELNTDVKI
ncbi:MAG: hypothetical protein KBB55_03260 [Candidatus Buchananbacteria bacterium]|nr:hypothetical protein [Candidatus Buchananbacteria bacterium]